jgi:hypothetical protein
MNLQQHAVRTSNLGRFVLMAEVGPLKLRPQMQLDSPCCNSDVPDYITEYIQINEITGHNISTPSDSAYAERYMGLPNVTGNYKGYDEADVNLRVDQLRDKMFYLVHGTADDNVHFQQSMTLAKNLANKGILFRQQVNNNSRVCK